MDIDLAMTTENKTLVKVTELLFKNKDLEIKIKDVGQEDQNITSGQRRSLRCKEGTGIRFTIVPDIIKISKVQKIPLLEATQVLQRVLPIN